MKVHVGGYLRTWRPRKKPRGADPKLVEPKTLIDEGARVSQETAQASWCGHGKRTPNKMLLWFFILRHPK